MNRRRKRRGKRHGAQRDLLLAIPSLSKGCPAYLLCDPLTTAYVETRYERIGVFWRGSTPVITASLFLPACPRTRTLKQLGD